MTDKPPKNPVFADLMTRLDLTEGQAAAYFGVPVFTFRKWLSGERSPSASVLRLVEITSRQQQTQRTLLDRLRVECPGKEEGRMQNAECNGDSRRPSRVAQERP